MNTKMKMVFSIVSLVLMATTACAGAPNGPAPKATPTYWYMPVFPVAPTAFPTPLPVATAIPTATPVPMACGAPVFGPIQDDKASYKKLDESFSPQVVPIGAGVFSVRLAGSEIVGAIDLDLPNVVWVTRDSGSWGVAYEPGQIYSLTLTCITEGRSARTEEVRFYFTGFEGYFFFPGKNK